MTNTLVIDDGEQTLTNKTINDSDNTITITSVSITDFDTEVSNNIDVAANTSARHSEVTIGTANGLSLSGQEISLSKATSTTTGTLSSSDWTSFNAKWDNINDLPKAIPSSGDTTHISTADQIYDFVIGQGYITTVAYTDLTGSPSDVITAGTNLSWDGNTLNSTATTIDEINDIGDVDSPTPNDYELLYYDDTSGNWKDGSPSTIIVAGSNLSWSGDRIITMDDAIEITSVTLNSGATVNSINTTFVDNDTSIMTSQAVKNKIEDYSYITASSTNTLTNKSGSNSQWTNDEGYITDYTVTNSDLTGLNNSELTNDSGYITDYTVTNNDLTGLNISELNNDSGYTTYSANQSLDTTDSPTFGGLTINGDVDMNSNNITEIGEAQFGASNEASITYNSTSETIDFNV